MNYECCVCFCFLGSEFRVIKLSIQKNKVALTHHIKKIFIISLWIVAGVGVMALLIAAIRIKREKICKGYEIDIHNAKNGKGFLDKKNVVAILTGNGKETLKGKSTRTVELQKLEALLERDKWIKDAELFFDNNQVLQVKITERKPVARVFTVNGNSFYIDSTCERLPLSDKVSAKVPVFTGFPSGKSVLKPVDKLLLEQIKNVSGFIIKDPFWMAQISQVDISQDRAFEIIPTIGNHIIEFGDGNNCDQKFKRLFIFYSQVLSKTGMERYARINVQYEKQIIGVRNAYLSKTDSMKFVKSVEYLIASLTKMDTVKRDSSATTARQNLENRIQNTGVDSGDARSKLVRQ
jgi:cell division protein FtsQ